MKYGSHAPARLSSVSMSLQICQSPSCQLQDPNHVHHPLNNHPLEVKQLSPQEFRERIHAINRKPRSSARDHPTVLLAPTTGLPWLFRALNTPKRLLIHSPDPSLRFPISRVCLLGAFGCFQEVSFQLVPEILGLSAPIRIWHLVPTSTQSSTQPLLTLELLFRPTLQPQESSEPSLTQTMPMLISAPGLRSVVASLHQASASGILPPTLIVVEPSSD